MGLQLLKNRWHGLSMTSEFCGPDSKELFEYNLKKMPQDWLWRTKTVRYSLNSQNYRCQEFDEIDWQNSIIMFGCSYVFGCGIDDSDTMSHQLSLMLNRPVINLAQGATDQRFQWANTCRLWEAEIRKPYAVIYVWPGIHRFTEFKKNLATENWGSWNGSNYDCPVTKLLVNEEHNFEMLDYLSTSVRSMWQCPVLEYYAYEFRPWTRGVIKAWSHVDVNDPARDYDKDGRFHPGPNNNLRYVKDYLYPDLQSLNLA
jgi:hypothetical protein